MNTMVQDKTGGLPDFDKFWDYNDPAATEKKFRDILPSTEGHVAYRLELQTQIGRTLGLQQKFTEAHTLLDSVQSSLVDDMKRVRVRYLLERGRVFNSSKEKGRALPLFKEAWEVGKAAKEESLAMDAAHMVAIASEAEESLKWNLMAIDLAEKSKDAEVAKWLGALYNNTGFSYIEKKDYDQAMGFFKKGLAYREERGQKPQARIAKWTVAHTHRLKGEFETAYTQQLSLLKEIETEKADQDGYVFEEIAECLLAMDKKDEAKPYFTKAYSLLSKDQWLQSNEPKRLKRLEELGS